MLKKACSSCFRKAQPEVDLARFRDQPLVVVLRVVRAQNQLEVRVPEHLDHDLPIHALLRHRAGPVFSQPVRDEVLLEPEVLANQTESLLDVVSVKLRAAFRLRTPTGYAG